MNSSSEILAALAIVEGVLDGDRLKYPVVGGRERHLPTLVIRDCLQFCLHRSPGDDNIRRALAKLAELKTSVETYRDKSGIPLGLQLGYEQRLDQADAYVDQQFRGGHFDFMLKVNKESADDAYALLDATQREALMLLAMSRFHQLQVDSSSRRERIGR